MKRFLITATLAAVCGVCLAQVQDDENKGDGGAGETCAIVKVDRRLSALSVPHNLNEDMIFDTVVDTQGDISVDLGAGTVTINVTGWYDVTFSWSSGSVHNTNSFMRSLIFLGPTTALQSQFYSSATSGLVHAPVSDRFYLIAGTVITVQVRQTSGAPINTQTSTWLLPRLAVVQTDCAARGT